MLRKKRIAVFTIALLATLMNMSPASAHTVRRYKSPGHHKPFYRAPGHPRPVRASRSGRRIRALIVPPLPQPWDAVKEHIAACESGGRYDARNRHSTASGKYQFLNSTWAGRYGVKRAYLATPEQQEQAAADLHAQSGLRPWSASQRCWRRRLSIGGN